MQHNGISIQKGRSPEHTTRAWCLGGVALSKTVSHTSIKSTRFHCSEVLKTVQLPESESRMLVVRVGGGGMAGQWVIKCSLLLRVEALEACSKWWACSHVHCIVHVKTEEGRLHAECSYYNESNTDYSRQSYFRLKVGKQAKRAWNGQNLIRGRSVAMTTEETCVCVFHVNPWKERVLQREGSQLFVLEHRGTGGYRLPYMWPEHQCLRHKANFMSLDVS